MQSADPPALAQHKARLEHLEATRLQPVPAFWPPPPTEPVAAWQWVCDKCSDPVCEHKLFSQLLEDRPPGAQGNS